MLSPFSSQDALKGRCTITGLAMKVPRIGQDNTV